MEGKKEITCFERSENELDKELCAFQFLVLVFLQELVSQSHKMLDKTCKAE
ncbi:hypothetical protein HY991_00975 [Candidatus Micrarchaeota archaeon]|nr:hypothetical protein [Candidatus Micrarchaeota archaeon]